MVGHALATMTVQAGAERLALGDARPETSQVLGQIEVTGRQTLQEMRRLLGVLRDPGGRRGPRATARAGPARRARRADATGRVWPWTSRSAGDGRSLSPGVDISAYRIVQEALTNVLKHADARTRAGPRRRRRRRPSTIEVTDDGAGAAGAAGGRARG